MESSGKNAPYKGLGAAYSLSLPGPPPPVALLEWQARIARLSNSTAQGIEHTRILPRPRNFTKPPVKFVAITLRHRPHIQQLEVGFNGATYARKIAQPPFVLATFR
jgi:hypothetical protein